jgi:ankyrin repeat protein
MSTNNLIDAIKEGDLKLVELQIRAGNQNLLFPCDEATALQVYPAEPNSKLRMRSHARKFTLAVYACTFGNLSALKLLKEAGAGLTFDSQNLLHFAGSVPVAEYLLAAGAPPNGVLETLEFDINSRTKIYHETVLMLAAARGNYNVCEFFIQRGAAVNLNKYPNLTPLMRASFNGHVDVCRLLIDSGADVDDQDSQGVDALMWAVTRRHIEVCRLLLKRGASVAPNSNGDSALKSAAGNWSSGGSLEICRLLLENGAELNVPGADGNCETPLIIAARCGQLEICKLFIDSGADLNIECACASSANSQRRNCQFRNPLTAALYANHLSIAEYLITQGANCDLVHEPHRNKLPTAERLAQDAAMEA